MTIYLYVKQHRITGLKYFGKTAIQNPYTYKGSGKHWKRHLKKHGSNVATVNVWQFEDLNECETFALKFSEDNNIVESKEWANMKIENGKDGGPPSPKSIKKMLKTRKKNGTLSPSPETHKKIIESKKKNGTTGKGIKKLQEHVAKVVETRKANGSYGHKQTPESIQKQIETKRIKGNLVHSRESYLKAWETRRAKKVGNHSPTTPS